MIERYSTVAMSEIWSRTSKTQRWLQVEIAICEAFARKRLIPQADLDAIRQHAGFDLDRCDEIERETRHDLMAFVRCVSETIQKATGDITPSPSRWIHFGVTSYDVIDTALGMMLRDSCEVLASSIESLIASIGRLFERHGQVPCIGRTHGIHAEPITFGHKLEGWNEELLRALERLEFHRNQIAVGKISGAVGIHAHVSREMETEICESLGLKADPSSTQIVARDRHAALMTDMAVLAGSLERIATELRNLQRTEILEVQEEFAPGQTGSSAMPHKRNPWNAETVCGLARVVRGNAHAMLESVMTWHERDLTNSSLERIVFPDTFHLMDFMLGRLTRILDGLIVLPENMARNLRQMGDLVFSEHVMVALIQRGLSREQSYKVAQRHAALAWDGADFKQSVCSDPEVTALLTEAELDSLFSLEHHLRHAPKSLRRRNESRAYSDR